jgi:hypothetical protein
MLAFLPVIKQVLEILALIGVVGAAFGFGWAQFRSGQTKQASQQTIDNTNVLTLMQKELDVLTATVARLTLENKESTAKYHQEIGELKTEVGRLNGIIQEKDGKLMEYKEIFQGRNPQLDEFVKSSGEFQGVLMAFMIDMKKYIEASHADHSKD